MCELIFLESQLKGTGEWYSDRVLGGTGQFWLVTQKGESTEEKLFDSGLGRYVGC